MTSKKNHSLANLTRQVLLTNKKKLIHTNQNRKEFNFTIARSINNICSVYSLTAKSFFRNGGAGFFILFFPLLLILITGSLFSGGPNPLPANIIIAGISVSAITGSGLNGLSIRMTQWKQSTIIRRIGCMPLKKLDFLLGVILFYFCLMCFQALYVLFIGYLVSLQGHIIGHFDRSAFNWQFLIGGWFLSMIFSLSLGIFLSTLTNDPNTNSLFGIMIFLPAAFLSGQYIPLSQIDKRSGLHIASQIWPQRYLVYLVQHGFYQKGFLVKSTPSPWLYICYPLGVSIIVILLAAKFFKWES